MLKLLSFSCSLHELAALSRPSEHTAYSLNPNGANTPENITLSSWLAPIQNFKILWQSSNRIGIVGVPQVVSDDWTTAAEWTDRKLGPRIQNQLISVTSLRLHDCTS
jgi:hypothetical protein